MSYTLSTSIKMIGEWFFTKKFKSLKQVIDIFGVLDFYRKKDKLYDEVYETYTVSVEQIRSITKQYIDEIFKSQNNNSNEFQEMNDIVKEGDVVEAIYCYGWKGTSLLRCRISDNILECKSNK